jgi:hypothetical protein
VPVHVHPQAVQTIDTAVILPSIMAGLASHHPAREIVSPGFKLYRVHGVPFPSRKPRTKRISSNSVRQLSMMDYVLVIKYSMH